MTLSSCSDAAEGVRQAAGSCEALDSRWHRPALTGIIVFAGLNPDFSYPNLGVGQFNLTFTTVFLSTNFWFVVHFFGLISNRCKLSASMEDLRSPCSNNTFLLAGSARGRNVHHAPIEAENHAWHPRERNRLRSLASWYDVPMVPCLT